MHSYYESGSTLVSAPLEPQSGEEGRGLPSILVCPGLRASWNVRFSALKLGESQTNWESWSLYFRHKHRFVSPRIRTGRLRVWGTPGGTTCCRPGALSGSFTWSCAWIVMSGRGEVLEGVSPTDSSPPSQFFTPHHSQGGDKGSLGPGIGRLYQPRGPSLLYEEEGSPKSALKGRLVLPWGLHGVYLRG